jgi:hypothetical protein
MTINRNRAALVMVMLVLTFHGIAQADEEPSIVIDGEFLDWTAVPLHAKDPAEGSGLCDWRELYVTHDATNWYVRYVCQDDIDFDLRAVYSILIDTDRNERTGYRGGGEEHPLGADYMVQGDAYFAYTGNGRDWLWKVRGVVSNAVEANEVELAVPRAWLGEPYRIFFILYGDNENVGKGQNDYVPNSTTHGGSAGAALRYSFRRRN